MGKNMRKTRIRILFMTWNYIKWGIWWNGGGGRLSRLTHGRGRGSSRASSFHKNVCAVDLMVDLLQHSYQKKQKSSSIPNRTFVSKSSSILKTLGRRRNDFYQKIYRFFLLYLRLVTRLLRLLRFRLRFRFVCLRLPPPRLSPLEGLTL